MDKVAGWSAGVTGSLRALRVGSPPAVLLTRGVAVVLATAYPTKISRQPGRTEGCTPAEIIGAGLAKGIEEDVRSCSYPDVEVRLARRVGLENRGGLLEGDPREVGIRPQHPVTTDALDALWKAARPPEGHGGAVGGSLGSHYRAAR
jgi:hypothetical protein